MFIGLDLDGVVADLLPGVAARIEAHFGIATHPSTWIHYDLRDLRLGLPQARFVTFLDDVFRDPSLYREAPLQPGALSGLDRLLAAGWRAVGITARPAQLSGVTRTWLREHNMNLETVFHTSRGRKDRLARELGVTATLEDNAAEAELLGGVCESWLFDQPYNRNHEPIACRRVSSWEDVVQQLCQLRLFA